VIDKTCTSAAASLRYFGLQVTFKTKCRLTDQKGTFGKVKVPRVLAVNISDTQKNLKLFILLGSMDCFLLNVNEYCSVHYKNLKINLKNTKYWK